jgi:short-subunit dehydrogenase
MKDLRGKSAVLTGASRGLGPYIARALARKGVNLALAARTADAVEATAKEASALGVRAIAVPTDVTNQASRERLLERAVAANGPIDILVNNAGIEWVCEYAKMSAEQIEQMIQTNLVAPLILSRLVLPEMIARGSGHVVMMSSLGGKKGSPYSATYAATKAGLIEWTSGVREELRGTGVSASVICPGFVA